MKTVIETFIIEETQELIYDNEKLDKWNQYVTELGLSGQKELVKEGKSPVPFLHMKDSLVSVFEVLCPRKVGIEKYNRTPIPVEILDLVALSNKEGYFEKIEVWYDEETPDPCVIGFMPGENHDKSEWYAHYWERYLIGRWADVKQSLEELTTKARMLFIKREKSQKEKTIRDVQRQLEDLENSADRKFGVNVGEESDSLAF